MRLHFFASCIFSLVFLGPLASLAFAQKQEEAENYMALASREEFRRGVQAYNRYSFNEAILLLEKALAYNLGDPLLLDWLGRAYYRSGLEDTALRQWKASLNIYGSKSAEGLLLGSRIETIQNYRSIYPELDKNERYVEAGRYPGINGALQLYRQPTTILPLLDGSSWVAAYGSNELVLIDQNGIIRQRVRGPLNGFDRPYDIVRNKEGNLYVSEFKGNRISKLDAKGQWKAYINGKEKDKGQLIGPQHMAIDKDGYLYVNDFGNRRIVKFDSDGTFILVLGLKSSSFPGLKTPTGLTCRGSEIFVADAGANYIVRFDHSGNYLGTLAEGAFFHPESIRTDPTGKLLVADTKHILLVDPETKQVHELGNLGNANVRIVAADMDRNGNILAVNFAASEVSVLTRMEDLAAGLFVQIERIIADTFPEVTLELRVQDRRRSPIIGLNEKNFLLSEAGRPVNKQTFMGASYLNTKADIALLVERSPSAATQANTIVSAVKDITAAADRIVALVSAGEHPIKEALTPPSALSASARGSPSTYGPRWKFDLALRLAATELLAKEKKRAVFFITTGKLGERAFERYSVSELATYLANNGIRFYAALLSNVNPDEELTYLCKQTGGQLIFIFRPSGIAPAIAQLKNAPTDLYALKYTSTLPTNFGHSYLQVEAEAYLLDRSGRDVMGYFPLLE